MRALSTSDLLQLWESGARLHSLDRGLLAIAAASPQQLASTRSTSSSDPADWPLGQRNRALLDLHVSTFGHTLKGWAACAGCGEKLEFELDAETWAGEAVPLGSDTIDFHGDHFRLPTSRDLAEASRERDSARSVRTLVARCCVSGTPPDDLDIESLGDALSHADPLGELRVSLSCPSCGVECHEAIDLVAFVWSELEATARRALWEVHAIASAYGWSEPQILALSSVRRTQYVAMVRS